MSITEILLILFVIVAGGIAIAAITLAFVYRDDDAASTNGSMLLVSGLKDFPVPVEGVITIPKGESYHIVGSVDLEGNRLSLNGSVSLTGESSETSFLYSTGLPSGKSLITSAHTLPCQNITFGCPGDTSVFDLKGDGTNGCDIQNVNFGSATLVCGNVGTIAGFSNFVAFNCALLNVLGSGFVFDGTFGTITFNQCLFGSAIGSRHIDLPSSLTITRRFRVDYSSFVVLAGKTGIRIATTAVPPTSFILDTVNFSGPGTAVERIGVNGNISFINNCVGIDNSTENGAYSMLGNATATAVSGGAFSKILGTTVPSALNQKFETSVSNRLEYKGAIQSNFVASAVCSLSSGNNKLLQLVFYKNGQPVTESVIEVKTDGSGDSQAVAAQAFLNLEEDDVLEMWLSNQTDDTAVTVVDMSVIVYRV